MASSGGDLRQACRLVVTGPTEVISRLAEELRGDCSELSFFRILPPPGGLRFRERHGSDVQDADEVTDDVHAWRRRWWNSVWDANVTPEAVVRIGLGELTRLEYPFQTTHGPPAKVVQALADRWPDCEVVLRHRDLATGRRGRLAPKT